jgi:hypothetical protein
VGSASVYRFSLLFDWALAVDRSKEKPVELGKSYFKHGRRCEAEFKRQSGIEASNKK